MTRTVKLKRVTPDNLLVINEVAIAIHTYGACLPKIRWLASRGLVCADATTDSVRFHVTRWAVHPKGDMLWMHTHLEAIISEWFEFCQASLARRLVVHVAESYGHHAVSDELEASVVAQRELIDLVERLGHEN